MARINNEVFDRPIKPVAARALITTVRDIAQYLTIGKCCSIVAVVQNAIKRMNYGEWIESANFDAGFWVCSECGFVSEAIAAHKLYNYCPNCGKKMRMEVKDDE